MKRTMFKRVLSVVLACTMIFSIFSICASAEDNIGLTYYQSGRISSNVTNFTNGTLLLAIEALIAKYEDNDPTTINPVTLATNLYIDENPSITDISGVFDLLPNLNLISANNCGIEDVSCFANFANSNEDTHKTLYLEGNGIYDLTPFESMPTIEYLNLSNNLITNIIPLSSEGKDPYYHLDLCNNYISDARSLKKFTYAYTSDATEVFHLDGNYCSTGDQTTELGSIPYDLETQKAIPANNPFVGKIIGGVGQIVGYYGGIDDTNATIVSTPIPNTNGQSKVYVTFKEKNSNNVPTETTGEVTMIAPRAFRDNTTIHVFHMPDNIIQIGEEAFENCVTLRRIRLSESITTIKEHTFHNCVELAGIYIPEAVTTIGYFAFRRCFRLKAVEFVNKDTTINTYAFRRCDSEILEFYVDSSIENDDFNNSVLKSNIEALDISTDGLSYNYVNPIRRDFDYTAKSDNTETGVLTATTCDEDVLKVPAGLNKVDIDTTISNADYVSIVFPEGVTSIDLALAYADSQSVSVLIPDTATIIDLDFSDNVTATVYSNSKLVLDENENKVKEIQNPYAISYANKIENNYTSNTDYNISYDVLNSYNGNPTQGESLMIPANLGFDIIGVGAFYYSNNENVHNIGSITLPNGIREIRALAFRRCSYITSFTFGNDNKLKKIGDMALSYFLILNSINIPSSVTTIGSYCFEYNANMVSVNFGDNSQLTTIGTNIFDTCTDLKNNGTGNSDEFHIPEGVSHIPAHAFDSCVSLEILHLPYQIDEESELNTSAFEHIEDYSVTIYCHSNIWDSIYFDIKQNPISYENSLYSRAMCISQSENQNNDIDISDSVVSNYLNDKTDNEIDISEMLYEVALSAISTGKTNL